jgi:hypothetical protein
MIGSRNKIFLIVDRGPAHVAKKTKAFVAGLGSKLRLFYLPPYSPDRNPDELVWKHLKSDTVGRTSITCLDDFRNKVKSSMLSLQRDPGKSAHSSTNPPSDTPPECLHTRATALRLMSMFSGPLTTAISIGCRSVRTPLKTDSFVSETGASVFLVGVSQPLSNASAVDLVAVCARGPSRAWGHGMPLGKRHMGWLPFHVLSESTRAAIHRIS